MLTPSVSVVIPSHNRAQLVMRALDSVRSQTYPADEILVVDDGSEDDTLKRIRLEQQDVHVLEQPHSGVSAARNLGIREATGDWIAFLDSDDEWMPQKLEKQLAALAKTPNLAFCHTDEIWIRNGRRVNPMKKHRKYGGNIFEQCLPLCVISPSSTILHRRLFEEVGLFDESLPACEDYDLWLRITARFPVLYIDEPLIMKYGGHEGQLSQHFWGMDRFRIRALENILNSKILTKKQREAAEKILVAKIRIYLIGARKRYKHADVMAYEKKLAQHLGPSQA